MNPARKTTPAEDRRLLAAAAKRRDSVLTDLVSTARDLELLEARRLNLLARRDALVSEAVALNVSMVNIARHAGTSRQALLKRLATDTPEMR